MSIGQIQGDSGVNPLKDQGVNQLPKGVKHGSEAEQLKLGGDKVELSEKAKQLQEISRFKKELDSIPSPNEGRINELKQSIADGTFITERSLNETAQRLADQLMK